MIRTERRMPPGTRRRGFIIPMPHTRAAQKCVQGYLGAFLDDLGRHLTGS